jgi:hypothetical protein
MGTAVTLIWPRVTTIEYGNTVTRLSCPSVMWKVTRVTKRFLFFALISLVDHQRCAFGDEIRTMGSLSECVDNLILPIDGMLARSAGGSSGPIIVSLHIGEGGRLGATTFEGGGERFQEQITQALKLSRFSAGCSGKTLRLVFSFDIEGEPTDQPGVWYSFSSPNRFTLHTHPRKTNVLRTRQPK